MTEETQLKLVKANPRTEVRDVSAGKWSTRTYKKEFKVHDLELHHPETGEPIFSVRQKPHRKIGNYELSWHPYMKDTHPELERSYEHGTRHHDYGHFDASSKDYLGWHGGRLYDAAARSGFKDTLPHTITPKPTEEDPTAHRITFHDPDTGDAIVHKDSGYSGKVTYSGDYIKKHDIHPDVVKTTGNAHPYPLAKAIHAEKGKSYDMIGHKTFPQAKTNSYTSGKKESGEVLSRKHEAILREAKGKHGANFVLTRTSPTTFHAVHPKYEGANPNDGHTLHTSTVIGDKLYHHEVDTGGDYDGSPLAGVRKNAPSEPS